MVAVDMSLANGTQPARSLNGPRAVPPTAVPEVPDGFWYAVKRRVLGPPLVTEQLTNERLSKPLALGVLSCDGLSSAAYGTEEILYALLPFFGLAAFTLVLPMTLLVLFGVMLVVLSYRQVVSVYTRAGGSYVVARENFGPRVAQVAAVALLIDYVVTVAVQTAAGSAAIVSAFPALSRIPVTSLMTSWEKDHPEISVLRQVTSMSPRAALLDAGAEAQLLVMGGRGGGGIPGMTLGSVTSVIAHHARCPVGIVRE